MATFQIDLKRRPHFMSRACIRFQDIRQIVADSAAVQNTLHKPARFKRRSNEVEAVKVHYLVPHRYKVVQEFLLGVLTSIDFRQGPELGVRTKDEVDTGAGPLEFTR